MNLNSDVLDDITDAPLVDGDTVKMPGSEVVPQESITVQTGDEAPVSQSVVPEEEIEKLPNLDVTLKIIEDSQEKVIAMKDVQNQILGENGVSQESIQEAQTVFDTLLKGHVGLNEFTRSKSKTHYSYVQRHMKQSIALEEASVVSNFDMFVSTPLEQAKASYQGILLTYLPALRERLNALRAITADQQSGLLNGVNKVVCYGQADFINVMTVNFGSFDSTKIVGPTAEQASYFNSLGLLTKNIALVNFLHCVKNGAPANTAIPLEYNPTYMGIDTTGEDLVAIYSRDFEPYVREVEQQCTAQMQYLKQLTTDYAKHTETVEGMNKFVAESMPGILASFKLLDRSMNLIKDLSVFTFNAQGFFKYASSL